jgi:hypothetical protein
MTLLTITQNAADVIGIVRPTSVANSTDQQVRQLFSLLNTLGKDLAGDQDQGWQALTREYSFTTVAAEAQVAAIPDDFAWFLPDCMFNRSQSRQMVGPVSPQDWQAIKALGSVAPANLLWRERGGVILLTPQPAAGETVAYEYSSVNWVLNGTTPAPQFIYDTDTTLLSEELLTLGLIYRFKQAKGFDYAEDMRSYELEKQRTMARDGGQKKINAAYTPWADMAGLLALNIPQTIPVPTP